jgi:hypothetical protein
MGRNRVPEITWHEEVLVRVRDIKPGMVIKERYQLSTLNPDPLDPMRYNRWMIGKTILQPGNATALVTDVTHHTVKEKRSQVYYVVLMGREVYPSSKRLGDAYKRSFKEDYPDMYFLVGKRND